MARKLLYSANGVAKFQDDDHPHGEIVFLALFNEYVVKFSKVWFEGEKTRIFFFDYEQKNIKRKEDVNSFIVEKGIIIEDETIVDHPLAHGLPDCRSVRPNISPV